MGISRICRGNDAAHIAKCHGVYGRSSHNKNGIGGPRETAYEGEEIVPSVFLLVANTAFLDIESFSTKDLSMIK